jgi:hypothetical protein
VLYRRNNVGVSAASADIAVHRLLHVVVGGSDRFLEKCDSGHDLTRGTVAALIAIMLDEGRLHRMKMARLAYALDGRDLIVGMHDSKGEAGVYPTTIDVNSTCATLAVIAAFFGAGKIEIFTKAVEKRGAGIKLKAVLHAIDP